MSQRDIPRAQWKEFLESFASRHRAWLATLEEQPHGAAPSSSAAERPLKALEAEASGAGILIRFADDPIPIRVESPRALRVNETARGEELGLELESARGVTRLRFRAPALPEEVDGLMPAER
jgi:hypothetical protein